MAKRLFKVRRKLNRTANSQYTSSNEQPSEAKFGPELTPSNILELQRQLGNRQTTQILAQRTAQHVVNRFYVESDNPEGYTWVDNSTWDDNIYEVSPNSTLIKGWVFHNLYRKKSVPPQPKVDPEPKQKAPQEDPTPKQPKQEEHTNEKAQTPTEPTFDGIVEYNNQRNYFYVNNSQVGPLKLDAGSFTIALNTPITYKIIAKNTFLNVAQVINAGPRPESISTNQKILEAQTERTEAVQKGQLLTPNAIQIIGSNSSGARKHYSDHDALARDDNEVYELLDQHISTNNYTVSPKDNISDQFTINLGKNTQKAKMSIIGTITYTNSQKTTVKNIVVFHVGPSI